MGGGGMFGFSYGNEIDAIDDGYFTAFILYEKRARVHWRRFASRDFKGCFPRNQEKADSSGKPRPSE
jgi:hypothetical protein